MKQQTLEERRDVPVQWRDIQIEKRYIDEEARTVEVAFSSETPVERFFGNEILDHGAGSVRLGRFQSGAAVLVDHDRKDHVGVVSSVSLSDRVGRAVIRLGQSARAQEIFQDVVDGIRHGISIGYRIHKGVLEEADDEKGDTYRVTDWEPLELSFVSIPADATVGVGRDADDTNSAIFERHVAMTEEVKVEAPAPKIDVNAEREKARAEEKKRIRTLTALGDKFDLEDDAQRFIDEGKSESEFRDFVLDNVQRNAPAEPITHLDLSRTEVKKYDLLRALDAMSNGRMHKDAPFELECSEEIESRMGRSPRGMFVPWDYQVDSRSTKMQSRAAPMDTSENSHLVGTDHLAGSFIELLRTETVVIQSGARLLTGLVGNVDIPKQAGKSTGYWVAEDGEPTDSEVPTATVSLSPKTVAIAVPVTRRLLKQSSPDAEAIVRGDLIETAAEMIDLAALEGSGTSNQPLGIVGQTGVLTQTVGSAGNPIWGELVGFETSLASANSLRGSPAFVTAPGVVGNLKTRAKDSGSGRFLLENGMANGYPVRTTTQITANRIIFGNYADVLIGMWGVLDMVADTATKVKSGGLVIRVFQDLDIAVRHGESFCIDA